MINKNIMLRRDQRRICNLRSPIHLQNDDGVDRIAELFLQCHDNGIFVSRPTEGSHFFVCQGVDSFWLAQQSGNDELSIVRPVKNMQVKPRPAIDLLLCASSPGKRPKRTRCGAVDCLAVLLHPLTHLLQPFDTCIREETFSGRPDIQEKISAF